MVNCSLGKTKGGHPTEVEQLYELFLKLVILAVHPHLVFVPLVFLCRLTLEKHELSSTSGMIVLPPRSS